MSGRRQRLARAAVEAGEPRQRAAHKSKDREVANAHKLVAEGTSDGGLSPVDIELMSWISMFCELNMNDCFLDVVREVFSLPRVARVELEALCAELSGSDLVPRVDREPLTPEQRCRVSVKLYDWSQKWSIDNMAINALLLPYESWKREHVVGYASLHRSRAEADR